MPTDANRARAPMSDAHKRALAVGREEGRAVRRYLQALESRRPKRGRRRSVPGIELRLRQIDARLPSADPLSRLHLVQERMNLRHELAASDNDGQLVSLEEGFVAAARNYGDRKGIGWAAWREAGVDASVLRRAGIRRRRA
jgi:hypothetical protein